jgi:hypothetical protein
VARVLTLIILITLVVSSNVALIIVELWALLCPAYSFVYRPVSWVLGNVIVIIQMSA